MHKCRISGCEVITLSSRYQLCTTHWREYGPRAEWPEWLKFLVSVERSIEYYDRMNQNRQVSLEYLVECGVINLDVMDIYRGPVRKIPAKKTRVRRSRNSGQLVKLDTF